MAEAPSKSAPAPAASPAAPSANGKPVSRVQAQFDKLAAAKPKAPRTFWGVGSIETEDEDLVIKVVQLVLDEAVRSRASDIHFEPLDDATRVRFRIDGMLEETLTIPRTVPIRTVSRIRVLASLDPEQNVASSKPQDGRFAFAVDGKDYDVRLSTFPTPLGDKAVLRLLHRENKVPELSQLGLKQTVIDTLMRLIHRPQGMIVVTGPAGNGKSTTLYTILQQLNTPQRNIITIEDPIELMVPGVTQAAVQTHVGMTFAAGLRAILRQDPNVIMVGEIRDLETAEIALSAALTGHLLFTTLHTNSALDAVVRMVDMGLEPYLISSALTAVMGQRLARRLCPACREAYPLTADDREALRATIARTGGTFPIDGLKQLFRAKGCDACRGTGYAGRILLFEMMQITPTVRQLILRKAPLSDLRQAALGEGAEPMFIDGLQKASAGITSLDEVLRVVVTDL